MAAEITPKQHAFFLEWMKDQNGTAAMLRLQPDLSYLSAAQQAHRYLSQPAVIEAIAMHLEERRSRFKKTEFKVLKKLKELAFYDAAEIGEFPINGPQDLYMLPDHLRTAIEGWSWDRQGNFVIKLAKKTPHIDMLGKFLGMWKNTVEHTGPNGTPLNTAPPALVIIPYGAPEPPKDEPAEE